MTRFSRVLRWLVLAAAIPVLGGCAAFYVDGHAPEVAASQFKKPAAPADVQLIWEFQTKGAPNARATAHLRQRVLDQIAASGLFTKVSESPVPGGALLSLTIDNVPLSDDAASKGFVAGLTFGLAGQTVGDGYDGTLRYSSGRDGAKPVQATGKQVIYTSIGNAGPPAGAQKMDNVEAAVTTMLRQMISRLLDALSKEPRFP